MMRTPSQTVGPYYAIGLCRRPENELARPDDPGAMRLVGRLLDGEGAPVGDGLIELWDAAGRRWGRSGTDADGSFSFVVTKPDGDAPHFDVYVFARGLLRHQLTRVYFSGRARRRRARVARCRRPRDACCGRRRGCPALRHPAAGRPADRLLRALSGFEPLFVPAPLREAVSDEAWLRAMLEAERALARAEAGVGVIPELGDEVFAADGLDAAELALAGRDAGNPVEPLVRALRERSEHVHHGATSQDILDTASALVARNATSADRHRARRRRARVRAARGRASRDA